MGEITRRKEKAAEALFREMLCVDDFNSVLEEIQKDRSSKSSELVELYRMLELCGIPYETDQTYNYYRKIVDAAASETDPEKPHIATREDIFDGIVHALYKQFKSYEKPEEYMLRLINTCGNPKWQNDTLRLRILKEFIEKGDYLKAAEINGKNAVQSYVKEKLCLEKKPEKEMILDNLDDGVFSVVDSPCQDREFMRPNGKYGLLKIADDLASGKFRAQGGTKKVLFLLAMVLDMTYYLDTEDIQRDDSTDIETNLFQKYYTNNLMRFITKAYKGNLDKYELDPSGQGINYKNFAEMIYLYYIRKDMDAADKIKRSHEMIESVKKIGEGRSSGLTAGDNPTAHYKNLPREENVFSLNEADFEQFILKNYDCNTKRTTYTVGPLQVDTEQFSAYNQYEELLKKLKAYDKSSADLVGYGIWFTDTDKLNYESMLKYGDVDPDDFASFKEMLRVMRHFMLYVVDENFSEQDKYDNEAPRAAVLAKKTALSVNSASDITRTSLLVAFYYYYNAKVFDRIHLSGEKRHESFSRFYDQFKNEADEYLEAAYYQPFSSRNLFDFLLLFSSYSYLYEF